MNHRKLVILIATLGAVLCFSFWPVQSGLKATVNCPSNADCPNPPELTPRLFYLLEGQPWHNNAGFTSKAEYCKLAVQCTNYHVDVPLSIIVGAVGGSLIGAYSIKKRFMRAKK
jgi:hypothetical protein